MVVQKVRLLFFLCLLFVPVLAQAEDDNVDPWESLNRKTFAFNEFFDRYLMKPIAEGYRSITPDIVEEGVSNFFANANEVLTVVNDVAQGKFKQGGQDTLRFIVNSTVGIAGFIDVGSRIGLEKHDEDFGQTLAYWGVPDGPFLMLPFLGPKLMRDTFTILPDNELSVLNTIDDSTTRLGLTAFGFVELRARLLDVEKLSVGDKYTFMRDAYVQRRQFLIRDGALTDEELFDDFDDFDDEDEDGF